VGEEAYNTDIGCEFHGFFVGDISWNIDGVFMAYILRQSNIAMEHLHEHLPWMEVVPFQPPKKEIFHCHVGLPKGKSIGDLPLQHTLW